MFNLRIVIPLSLQQETLQKVHEGHKGIIRSRMMKTSVWWPGISKHVSDFIQNCPVCAQDTEPQKEPLIMTPLPDYPWQMVGSDLFRIHNDHYLLTVDYFSRYPELTRLSTTISAAVISTLKTTFARFGISETVRSNNGPQFDSVEFANFASQYRFTHQTSSPRFPQ